MKSVEEEKDLLIENSLDISETEKAQFLEELGRQFDDFNRETKINIIETLRIIANILSGYQQDDVSFRDAVNEVKLDEIEKGQIKNAPTIPAGSTNAINLLLTRDNERVGNKLSFSMVYDFLKEKINS